MARVLLLLVTVALALGMLGAPTRPGVQGIAVAAECDWLDEYNDAIGELGEDPRDWTIAIIPGWSGMAYRDTVTAAINPNASCDEVRDTVLHEWMHLQQFRSGIQGAMKGRHEIIADCGMQLLGGTATTYIDPDSKHYLGDCTEFDLDWAEWFIVWRPRERG